MDKQLPPLNAIRAFEAASRHMSFVRAAEELGVTQSAVSKQIATLEDFIGGQLFERRAAGLSLTVEGRELKHSISPAFDMLHKSFHRYARRSPRSNKFRLATVASFASQFLAQRLDVFERQFPELELEILTSDRLLDLHREEVDLSIRYGAGDWEGLVSSPLVEGALVPVCTPSLVCEGEDTLQLLSKTRRIQGSSNDEWATWAAQSGICIPEDSRPFVMEHFNVALQAALAGQGVALLPEVIIRDYLKVGQLRQFSDVITWEQTFYATHIPQLKKQTTTRSVVAWLHEQAKE